MSSCPAGKPLDDCPCPEYSKEGLCDWPYRSDFDGGQIRYTTQLLQAVDEGGDTPDVG